MQGVFAKKKRFFLDGFPTGFLVQNALSKQGIVLFFGHNIGHY